MLDDQGAERVFVDIEPDTANIDPDLIEDAVTFRYMIRVGVDDPPRSANAPSASSPHTNPASASPPSASPPCAVVWGSGAYWSPEAVGIRLSRNGATGCGAGREGRARGKTATASQAPPTRSPSTAPSSASRRATSPSPSSPGAPASPSQSATTPDHLTAEQPDYVAEVFERARGGAVGADTVSAIVAATRPRRVQTHLFVPGTKPGVR